MWSTLAIAALGLGGSGCFTRAVEVSASLSRMHVNAEGTRLVKLLDEGTEIWDLQTHEQIATQPLERYLLDLALSPDGRWLATLDTTSPYRPRCRLHLQDLEAKRSLTRIGRTCEGVEFGPDGSTLLLSGRDHVILRELEPDFGLGQRLGRFEARAEVTAVALAPDRSALAIASSEMSEGGRDFIEVLPLDGSHAQTLEGHRVLVQAMLFLPDGRLVSGGVEHRRRQTVHLWSGEGEPEPLPGLRADEPVRSLALSPTGEVLLAAGVLGCGHVLMSWELGEAPRATPERLPAHEGTTRPSWPEAVAFRRDGLRVAVGNEVVVWDSEGAVVDVLFADPPAQISLCSSPVAWPTR